MALIEVNRNVLCDVATSITTYCEAQDREMCSADTEIKSMLSTGWTGPDAKEFGRKWEGVDDTDSVAVKFRESLEKFSDCLNFCATEYQKAQEDSYNEANRLPKYLYW